MLACCLGNVARVARAEPRLALQGNQKGEDAKQGVGWWGGGVCG